MSAPIISGIPKGVNKSKALKEKRIEKEKAPKVIENEKSCMILHGKNASAKVKDILKELVCI